MPEPFVSLAHDFYLQPTLNVARQLLGAILVRRFEDNTIAAGRIVETEAYTADDPACHAFRGLTPRNKTMFGPPGHAYIHINYGLHYCINAVTAPEGIAEAVLIRAIEPLVGVRRLWDNYVGKDAEATERDLSDKRLGAGPGRLTRALAVDKSFDGVDLTDGAGTLFIAMGEDVPDEDVVIATRIGITKGADFPWRFYVRSSRWVSRR